jgi:Skp family chaperone for outer membrane proteins
MEKKITIVQQLTELRENHSKVLSDFENQKEVLTGLETEKKALTDAKVELETKLAAEVEAVKAKDARIAELEKAQSDISAEMEKTKNVLLMQPEVSNGTSPVEDNGAVATTKNHSEIYAEIKDPIQASKYWAAHKHEWIPGQK